MIIFVRVFRHTMSDGDTSSSVIATILAISIGTHFDINLLRQLVHASICNPTNGNRQINPISMFLI